jgi:carbon monoxide dehydrogenase subunit G
MKLEHEFTVPAPVEEAWKVLLDVERVAPCMPGATLLTVDGDQFTGTVKVKVGPIQVTYKGQAKFASLDETAHRAVIEATGKEARGSGTAAATVTAVLVAAGGSTTNVKVETDLDVTGRPAQFGRGVMAEVAAKLIGQFANCLADELGSPSAETRTESPAPKPAKAPAAKKAAAKPAVDQPAVAQPAAAQTAAATTPAASAPKPAAASSGPRQVPPPARPAEAIDLLEVAGGSVAKRLAPVAGLIALLLFVLWRRRRQ